MLFLVRQVDLFSSRESPFCPLDLLFQQPLVGHSLTPLIQAARAAAAAAHTYIKFHFP